MTNEIWKDIAGYEGMYQVSNFGRVKSFLRGGRILTPKTNGRYLTVCLVRNGNRKYLLIHRLVAETFLPNPGKKPQVNHLDGDKHNNCTSNLEWVTQSENVCHAFATKLSPSGSACPWSKFTDEQIVYIRDNPDQLSQYQLAEKFGVSKVKISEVQLGKRYKNTGGTIRQSKRGLPCKIPIEQRQIIRATYVPYDPKFGCKPLAIKYGVHENTILRILNECQS